MINILKNKKHYILALAIMFVVVSLSDTTYSLFFKADSTDDFTYNTGLLDLQFIEDEQINIQNAFPMIDSEGIKTKPYTLTIKNTGSLPYLFNLEMLSTTAENVIDTKYIKVQVDKQSAKTLYETNNIIVSDIILYPNEERTFNIKVWLDINMPNSELGKTFMAKLVTNGQAVYKTLDTSGANYPELLEDMIPIYYNEETSTWHKADYNNSNEDYEWYNYDSQKWANVAIIKSSNKQIYDIKGNNNLKADEIRTNSSNFIADEAYLDIQLSNYQYNNISTILKVKFNNLTYDKIYIISNDIISYYYDMNVNKFIIKLSNNIIESSEYYIDKNKWYTIGFTYDNNLVTFYVNGNKLFSSNLSGSIYSEQSFKLGTDSTFKELSSIEISDIYIYQDILTEKEINTNYNNNINIIYDNLLLGYNDFEPKTIKERYTINDLGTEIKNEDIQSLYVWIPRYSYKLWNVTGTPGTDSYDAYNLGIDIIFENQTESSGVIRCEKNICYNDDLLITQVTNNDNNKYYTHPAFTSGDKKLKGIWVSKYEISSTSETCSKNDITGCLSSSLEIEIKPGKTVWRNNTLSNYYKNINSLDTNENNYNVIKNTEWGAITYLTHSKYGLCNNGLCKNIGTNRTYISGSEITDSTTYNIYGIFDLSGSASEFVMANYANQSGNINLENSNFEPQTISLADYDLYHQDKFILGDATKEISLTEKSWYNNQNTFINETNNWFIRGGIGPANNSGIFYYNATTDSQSEYITTRIVIK